MVTEVESPSSGLNSGSSAAGVLARGPIAWGVSFALSRKKALFLWSLIPAVVEVLVSWQVFSGPTSPQQILLLQVMQAIASAWLITVITMQAIQTQRGEPLSYSALASSAIRNLPKTFISYAALVCVVVLSLIVLPLVFLALFFIWAPLFCVGELYVEDDSIDDEDFEEPFDLDEDEIRSRPLFFFKNKSVLELGFARSLQFGARHISTTSKLAVLVIFAGVFPVASVDLLTPGYGNFTPEVIKIFFSSFCSAVVVGIAAGAFLVMLPDGAREEIGVSKLSDQEEKESGKRRFVNLDKKIAPFVVLLLVSLGCGGLIWQNILHSYRMPDNVLTEVRSTEIVGRQFVVDLRLSDPGRRFRWFNEEGFRIRYAKARSSLMGLSDNTGTAVSKKAGAADGDERKMSKQNRLVALDINGNEIPLHRLLPHDGPLLLRIYFDTPDPATDISEFSLFYVSHFDESRYLYSGTRSEW